MTLRFLRLILCLCFTISLFQIQSQIIINEGSNKNFNSILDEDQESEDWIELYNAGDEAVNLLGYTLTDNSNNPTQWTFTDYELAAHSHIVIFCSGKNRFYSNPFQHTATITDFTPSIGWNTHDMQSPFEWNGTSDIVMNVCAYNDHAYNGNSIFNQSNVSFYSSLVQVNDDNNSSCSANNGERHHTRPNIQINGVTIGTGNTNNEGTTYPAPYGNWYWCSRHQFLFKAEELIAAGIGAGPINSIAWDVINTGNDFYNYIDFAFKHVDMEEMSQTFVTNSGLYFHTNFKLLSTGETVYLYTPQGTLADELAVNVPIHTSSIGRFPDGENTSTFLLQTPTPDNTNSNSQQALGVLSGPLFSVETGVYPTIQSVHIYNTDNLNASIYYTTNGEEPTTESTLYNGEAIPVFQSTVLRARTYHEGYTASKITSASYLINVSHITPIVSIAIDNQHLYGGSGIFDNWQQDWERYAQMTFFDSTSAHNVLFHRNAAMQIDGGAGGSRSHAQHSFRLEFDKSAFGENEVLYPLLSNRPERSRYSRLYFRNGSNQWLTLPYKDACLTELMADNTKSYYSAMRPVSVYINGQYFGLYEMREKLDQEYYEVYDNALNSPMDVLSVSYWYNLILRATVGNPDNYYQSLEAFEQLEPSEPTFLEEANALYDLENMADYIITQSWIGNADWPYNNIKIHRDDSTGQRWRYTTIDLELSLAPNGWTDCYYNGLQHSMDDGNWNPYILPWRRSMNNDDYFNYFVNRFADLMNTNYKIERLIEIENRYFNEWVVEMPKEYQRWGDPWNVSGWMNDFYNRHLQLQDDLICKSEVMFDQVENTLDLEGQFDLTLNTIPEGAGVIHLNTISPTEYPWTGIYYKGIPVQLTAEANEGYQFMHWIDNGLFDDTLDAEWSGPIDLDEIAFTAVFEEIPVVNKVDENTQGQLTTLHVYPNPTKGNLYIENNERNISDWEIYTAQGKLISQSNNTYSIHQKQIDVSDYHAGIYLIKIKYADGGSENKRWVKS